MAERELKAEQQAKLDNDAEVVAEVQAS